MAKIDTEINVTEKEVGKKLYRQKTYYNMVVEHEVLADNKEEAEKQFSENAGLKHDLVNQTLGDGKNGVECYYLDANYSDSNNVEFIGTVDYDTYNYNQSYEEAKENGDVFVDTDAIEDAPHPLTKISLTPKQESDIDVALNLEAESQRGK